MPDHLKDVIQCKYNVRPLKSAGVRVSRSIQRLWFKGRSLTPLAWLVESADGRKFKLLQAEPRNRYMIDLFYGNWLVASQLDFIPRVLWRDKHNILVEYFEGWTPDIRSPVFARAFGECLASIHNTDIGSLPRRAVMYGVENYVTELFESGMVAESSAKSIKEGLMARLPDPLRTSLVCADLQPSNFCFTERGRLIWFDLGAFQSGRATDEFFFGHPLSRDIDFDVFRETYLASGGVSELFKWSSAVQVMSDVRMAAFFARTWRAIPAIQIRKRRTYYSWAKERISRLLAFADSA